MLPVVLHVAISPALVRTLLSLASVLAVGSGVIACARRLWGPAAAAIVWGVLVGVLHYWFRGRPTANSMAIELSPSGLALAFSMLVGGWLLLHQAYRLRISRERAWARLGLMVTSGLLGARAGYLILNPRRAESVFDWLNFGHGGLSGFGAFLGGSFALSLLMRREFVEYRRWLDLTVLPLLLGAGITRIGCYLSGCDFGRPLRSAAHPLIAGLGTFPRWQPSTGGYVAGSPVWVDQVLHWGLSPDAPCSLPVHPVQLYDAALALGLALLTIFLKRRRHPDGTLFAMMGILYSIGYLLLGTLRGDTERIRLTFGRFHYSMSLGSHDQLLALGAVLMLWVVYWNWSREQPLFARLWATSRGDSTHRN